jgi:hypothetical protein
MATDDDLTTEEERIAQLERVILDSRTNIGTITPERALRSLLDHFDEHEPKLGLALRKGIPESVSIELLEYGVQLVTSSPKPDYQAMWTELQAFIDWGVLLLHKKGDRAECAVVDKVSEKVGAIEAKHRG